MNSMSGTISEYFVKLSYDDIPQDIKQKIKYLIFDYLGVAARGSLSPSGNIAIQQVLNQCSDPMATVIGAKTKASPMLAAFANAISAHSIEMDDVDDLALFHFSPSVVSAALATGEKESVSGEELLTAVYAGCEIMERMSNVMNPSLRNRGFHTTPVCGSIGAVVSAGKLMRLDHEKLAHAMALAGTQSSGLMEFYGQSLQKRFNTGPPARNGVVAAEMARLGFTGCSRIFEGSRGLFRAFSDNPDTSVFLEGLGQTFPVHIDFKPYSSARPIHNGVDCALAIRAKSGFNVKNIQSITINRHPTWADYHQVYDPKNINEAQVSMPFAVAVSLKTGDAFLNQYTPDLFRDLEIKRLMNCIKIVADETLPRGVSCLMVVETYDGKSHEAQVDYPKGSDENPFTEEELIAKFKKLSGELISDAESEFVADQIFNLNKVVNIREFMGVFHWG